VLLEVDELWRTDRGRRYRSVAGEPGSLVGASSVVVLGGSIVSTVPPSAAVPARFGDIAVRTDGLVKRFGRTLAVDDLTLTVHAGEVFGFLGPNGAGKSTTIRMLLGLIRPTAGRARVFSDDSADVRQAHRHLAYVPAEVVLWPGLTGAEILELLARVGPGTDEAYRAELVTRFELDLDKPAGAYSTGNRQKVALVAAFSTVAPLLVLDEPTSGLDPLMEREFRRCVAEARGSGRTVFLSSHQLAEVEAVCDRVGILRSGRLVEVARIAELRRLRRTEVALSYTGAPPRLVDVPGVLGVEQVGPSRMRFSLAGPPAPALQAMTAAEVTAIEMREPTLEEIFLDYYGEAGR
jgi:ABC-2 type transport system ATP-binding protein